MENLFHKMFESIELFVHYLHFLIFFTKNKEAVGLYVGQYALECCQ